MKSPPADRLITGQKALDEALKSLKSSVANRVVRPAIGKSLRIISKAIKQEIHAPYKDAKRGIGARLGKTKNDKTVTAKVGSAVGMRAKKIKSVNESLKEKRKKRKGARKIVGVGISPSNIHWFILGTSQRRHEKTNKSVGVMKQRLGDVVTDGFNKSSAMALSSIHDTARKKLVELAEKVRSKSATK